MLFTKQTFLVNGILAFLPRNFSPFKQFRVEIKVGGKIFKETGHKKIFNLTFTASIAVWSFFGEAFQQFSPNFFMVEIEFNKAEVTENVKIAFE